MGLRVYVMLASFINAARIYAKKIVTRVRASKNFKIDPFFQNLELWALENVKY